MLLSKKHIGILPALVLANMKKPELNIGLHADSQWLPSKTKPFDWEHAQLILLFINAIFSQQERKDPKMYELTKEIVRGEHRKDLIREAEKYNILYPYPSRLLNTRGFYEKSLAYLGQLLSNLGRRLQARYGLSNTHPLKDY